MLSRVIAIVIVIPLAIVLIALAVANRGAAALTIDPFNPGNPALTWSMPLFVLLFAAVAFGMVIGSIATWLRQGRYRRLARQRPDVYRAPPANPPVAPLPHRTGQTGPSPARPALSGPGV